MAPKAHYRTLTSCSLCFQTCDFLLGQALTPSLNPNLEDHVCVFMTARGSVAKHWVAQVLGSATCRTQQCEPLQGNMESRA